MPVLGLSRRGNWDLTREIVESIIVQPLQARAVFLAAGPDFHDSDGSPIRLPKLQSSSPPQLYAENEEIQPSDIEFDSIRLLDPRVKSVKAMNRYSNELRRSAVVSIGSAISDRLIYDLAKDIDYLMFEGRGPAASDANGNYEPLGVINWVPVSDAQRVTIHGSPTGGTFTLSFRGQTTAPIDSDADAAAVTAALEALSTVGAGNVVVTGGPGPDTPWDATFSAALAGQNVPPLRAVHALTGGTNARMTIETTVPGREGAQVIDKAGTPPTLDDLHDAVGLALGAYAEPNRWFITPRHLTMLRKITDDMGRYQLSPDPTVANGYTLLGLPVSVTNHLAPGAPTDGPASIVLADMSQIAVGRDHEPTVEFTTERYFEFDQIAVRVTTRYDLAPRNAKGVVIIQNATTS